MPKLSKKLFFKAIDDYFSETATKPFGWNGLFNGFLGRLAFIFSDTYGIPKEIMLNEFKKKQDKMWRTFVRAYKIWKIKTN